MQFCLSLLLAVGLCTILAGSALAEPVKLQWGKETRSAKKPATTTTLRFVKPGLASAKPREQVIKQTAYESATPKLTSGRETVQPGQFVEPAEAPRSIVVQRANPFDGFRAAQLPAPGNVANPTNEPPSPETQLSPAAPAAPAAGKPAQEDDIFGESFSPTPAAPPQPQELPMPEPSAATPPAATAPTVAPPAVAAPAVTPIVPEPTAELVAEPSAVAAPASEPQPSTSPMAQPSVGSPVDVPESVPARGVQFEPVLPSGPGPEQSPRTSLPPPESRSIEEEGEKAKVSCDESLRNLREYTVDKVSLNIVIVGTEGQDYPFECSIDDGSMYGGRCWEQITYMWKASALCHKPLYFEEEQLERYGHSFTPCIQPFVSGAHFFCTLPVLPYCMGVEPPCECIYALGHYRPGNCAPYMINPVPLSLRGALFEAGAVTGTAAALP
ncbi:MAG: hypothetical protein IT425_09750 [Pirellulales bacterium]|nr:hypothetical protein [Pirellulales bacterium]